MKSTVKFRRDSGGVLLVVLAIVMVAAAITAGWISVMTAQLQYAEQYFTSSKRRVALANAAAMTRQYFLTQVLTRSSGPGASVDLGSGWGAVIIPATSTTPLTTFQKAAGYNHFSPGNGDGYSQSVSAVMSAGSVSQSVTVLTNSRSPVLSGIPVVMNSPSVSLSGTVVNEGASLLWQPAGSFALRSRSFFLPAAPSNATVGSSGAAIAPSNFPFVPITGSESGGAASYDGTLNVIQNASGINSLSTMVVNSSPNGLNIVDGSVSFSGNGVECDGGGVVTIDLANPALGNVRVTGNVTNLIFTGQTTEADRIIAGNAVAVLVVVNQSLPPELTDIEFGQSNNRKLALAVKSNSGAAAVLRFPQSGVGGWRLLLTLESVPATMQISGGSQILVGGIQSDQGIAVTGGSVTIAQEPDPKLLERLAARGGWLEVFAQ